MELVVRTAQELCSFLTPHQRYFLSHSILIRLGVATEFRRFEVVTSVVFTEVLVDNERSFRLIVTSVVLHEDWREFWRLKKWIGSRGEKKENRKNQSRMIMRSCGWLCERVNTRSLLFCIWGDSTKLQLQIPKLQTSINNDLLLLWPHTRRVVAPVFA